MKTTLEIPDPIFRRAKSVAAERGVALRVFITEAVEEKLAAASRTSGPKPKPFKVTPIPMSLPPFTKVEDLLDLLEGPDRR